LTHTQKNKRVGNDRKGGNCGHRQTVEKKKKKTRVEGGGNPGRAVQNVVKKKGAGKNCIR